MRLQRMILAVMAAGALGLWGCGTTQPDGDAAPVEEGIVQATELAPEPAVALTPTPMVAATRINVQPQVDELKKQLAPGGPDASKQGLVFDATRVNFGKIKSTAGILSATFTAHNRTDKPIQIVRTEKDCGCLLSRPLPNQVGPGETLTVMLQMNPSGKNGRLSHMFTIQTDEETPYYFLNMLADVELVRGADQPNIYIPSLVRGTTEHVQVIIDSASDILPRALFELPDANLVLGGTQVDGATLDLWITTAPTAVRGKIPARLIVRHPDTRAEAAIVPMIVVIDDNVHFNTPSIFLGRMKPGEPASKEVQLVSYFGDVPRVIRARVENERGEAGSVEVVRAPVATLVRVTADPDKAIGPVYRATLRVELESAEQPEALLPVLGIVEQKQNTLDFSATPTGP
ncbi:DUF1573 domain-containing protein [bacterium]|nr:DUF1573 domain-containing protein [bacterium]